MICVLCSTWFAFCFLHDLRSVFYMICFCFYDLRSVFYMICVLFSTWFAFCFLHDFVFYMICFCFFMICVLFLHDLFLFSMICVLFSTWFALCFLYDLFLFSTWFVSVFYDLRSVFYMICVLFSTCFVLFSLWFAFCFLHDLRSVSYMICVLLLHDLCSVFYMICVLFFSPNFFLHIYLRKEDTRRNIHIVYKKLNYSFWEKYKQNTVWVALSLFTFLPQTSLLMYILVRSLEYVSTRYKDCKPSPSTWFPFRLLTLRAKVPRVQLSSWQMKEVS